MHLVKHILLALGILSGCDNYSPQMSPAAQPAVATSKSIVVVTKDNCVWCDKQKATIASMQAAGELRDVRIVFSYPTKDYPATAFPTLYCCSGGRCHAPLIGYQTRQAILRALR